MKKLKLVFIPLVLATLVSCSSKSNGVKLSQNSRLDFYNKAYSLSNDDTELIKDVKCELITIDEYSIKKLNDSNSFGYISNSEGGYDLINLVDKKTIASGIDTLNSYPCSFNGYYNSAENTFISLDDIVLFFSEENGNYYLHILLKNQDIKFKNATNVTINTASDKRDNINRKYFFSVSFNGTNENLYCLSSKDGKYSVINENEYYCIDDDLFINYDLDGNITGYYSYSDAFLLEYNSKKEYIGKLSFEFLAELDSSYYSIALNDKIYYFKTEDYMHSDYVKASYEKYITDGYVIDLKTCDITYSDDLPFVILDANVNYNKKGAIITYQLLEDHKLLDQVYSTIFEGDFSRFNGEYPYDEYLSFDTIKLSNNTFVVYSKNNNNFAYASKDNFEILDIEYISISGKNKVEYCNFDDHYFYASKKDFYKDYKNNEKNKYNTLVTAAIEDKVYSATLNDNLKYEVEGIGELSDEYIGYYDWYYLAVTDDKIYYCDGTPLCNLEENCILIGVYWSYYYVEFLNDENISSSIFKIEIYNTVSSEYSYCFYKETYTYSA